MVVNILPLRHIRYQASTWCGSPWSSSFVSWPRSSAWSARLIQLGQLFAGGWWIRNPMTRWSTQWLRSWNPWHWWQKVNTSSKIQNFWRPTWPWLSSLSAGSCHCVPSCCWFSCSLSCWSWSKEPAVWSCQWFGQMKCDGGVACWFPWITWPTSCGFGPHSFGISANTWGPGPQVSHKSLPIVG